MPFARGTVNGITGLLRKAGAFAKACCCRKYKCDTTTYTCTEDPAGTYNSLAECDRNCNDKKYKCDTTSYDCTEDPLGPYDTIKECEDNCKEEKYYCCGSLGNPDDRGCYDKPCDELGLASFGVYDTAKECDENCKEKHYKCDVSSYTCTEDPTGAYTDPKECQDNCKPPPTYKCDTNSYDCTQDPWGPYTDLQECLDNCKEPKYYCCGSPGTPSDRDCYGQPCSEVGLDSFGEYDTPEECDDNCKPLYYYCCRQSDGSVVCTTDCTGGVQVSGPYKEADECECDAFRCDKSTYTCVQDPDGPYKTPEECESECKRKYDCVDNGDGTKSCVEVEGGPYESSDCDKQCDPRYDCVRNSEGDVECIQQEGGAYLSSDCDDECDKRYSCFDNPDGSRTCIEDNINGGYTTSNCNNECEKKKYKCSPLGDGTYECIEDPGGEYDEPTCGGQCDAGFFGLCCTDYGISNVNRQKCAEWGGTFYTDYLLAVADCGCDCAGTGGQVSILGECTETSTTSNPDHCGQDFDYCSKTEGQQDSYAGYSPVFPRDDPAGLLTDIVEKGAQIIGWVDGASSFANKPGDQEFTQCCILGAGRFVQNVRTFALNCRRKVWEEVANIYAGAPYNFDFVSGSGSTDGVNGPTCLGQLILASEEPSPPQITIVPSAPTCIPPQATPLP